MHSSASGEDRSPCRRPASYHRQLRRGAPLGLTVSMTAMEPRVAAQPWAMRHNRFAVTRASLRRNALLQKAQVLKLRISVDDAPPKSASVGTMKYALLRKAQARVIRVASSLAFRVYATTSIIRACATDAGSVGAEPKPARAQDGLSRPSRVFEVAHLPRKRPRRACSVER
jgi:hypothetical protein